MSSEKIIEDLGENYQYIKTIAENKIEIVKLQFLQKMYSSIGKAILAVILIFSTLLFIAALLVALSLYIGNILKSFSLGFLIGFSILIPINFIVFIFREVLIYRPLSHLILRKINTDEEE